MDTGNILTLVGIVLLVFQLNQNAISSIKERKIRAYSQFIEAAQLALPAKGKETSPDTKKALSSAIMEMTLFAAPNVLIEIVGLKDDQGRIAINDKKLVSLRLKIRKDSNFKIWEYIPLLNWVIYGIEEAKINREHMMQINIWD